MRPPWWVMTETMCACTEQEEDRCDWAGTFHKEHWLCTWRLGICRLAREPSPGHIAQRLKPRVVVTSRTGGPELPNSTPHVPLGKGLRPSHGARTALQGERACCLAASEGASIPDFRGHSDLSQAAALGQVVSLDIVAGHIRTMKTLSWHWVTTLGVHWEPRGHTAWYD